MIRETIQDIGYDDSTKGFDYKTCNVLTAVEKQSAEIASSVHVGKEEESMGAGDQVGVVKVPTVVLLGTTGCHGYHNLR